MNNQILKPETTSYKFYVFFSLIETPFVKISDSKNETMMINGILVTEQRVLFLTHIFIKMQNLNAKSSFSDYWCRISTDSGASRKTQTGIIIKTEFNAHLAVITASSTFA